MNYKSKIFKYSKMYFMVILMLFISSKSIFSQSGVSISLTMKNVDTGVTVNNCSTIDLDLDYIVEYNAKVKLTKQGVGVIGQGYIDIYTFKDQYETPYPLTASYTINSGNASEEVNITVFLNSTAYNASGGKLYAKFQTYESCKYDVIKTVPPTFNINNATVECGSTDIKTFTVGKTGGSPGAISYQWDLGSGWSHNGVPKSSLTTTQPSIQLVPLSYPPSNVKVTPIFKGVNQPQLTSNVTMKSISTYGYSISSPLGVLCGSSVFSVDNLPVNTSVVSWSIVNNSWFTIATNGNQATVSPTFSDAYGFVTVNATIQDSCGQQAVLSTTRHFGKAEIESVLFSNGIGETDYFCTSHAGNDYEFFPKLTGTTHQVRLSKFIPTTQVLYTSNWSNGDSGTLNYTPQPGYYLFEMRRTNDCGTTDWWGTEVEFVNCALFARSFSYSLYPNPATDELIIEKKNSESKNSIQNLNLKSNELIQYEVYNQELTKVLEGEFQSDKFRLDLTSLIKGKYIIKIYNNSTKRISTQQFLVK